MARLERRSFTRWENGVVKTYSKGDDVPDLKPSGDPEKPNVFLTREEGARVPAARAKSIAAKTIPTPEAEAGDDETAGADLDIIELLEGNVVSVVSWVKSQRQISILEDALVAEGEGKNRSTITSAINDQIRTLEQEEG